MKCSLKGRFNVQYTGSANIPTSIVAFYLSNDGTLDSTDTLLKQYRVGKMKPNQTTGKNLALKLPNGVSASGAYVIALVDVDDVVPDVDDVNNVISFGPLP